MRTKWLLIGIALFASVLAIGAAACGDDDNGDDGNGNGAVPTATEVMDDVEGDTDVLQLVAHLDEFGGSGASGEAELSANGDGILVSVVVEGLSEGSHANHIHEGTCDEQGEIRITLDNLVADESGDAMQTTANDEEPLSHFETGHYVAVHELDGAVIACGNVVEAS